MEDRAERQWENRAGHSSAYGNKQACHTNHSKSCFKFWSRSLTAHLPYAGTLLGRSGTKMKKTLSPVSAANTGTIRITQWVQQPCQTGCDGGWAPTRMGNPGLKNAEQRNHWDGNLRDGQGSAREAIQRRQLGAKEQGRQTFSPYLQAHQVSNSLNSLPFKIN